MVKPDSPQITI